MPSVFDGANSIPLEDYPGLGVLYADYHTSFTLSLLENLKYLSIKTRGLRLLDEIKKATPFYRHNFPGGINVIVTPFPARYIQSGYVRVLRYDVEKGEYYDLEKAEDTKSRPTDSKSRRPGAAKQQTGSLIYKGDGHRIAHESMDQYHASAPGRGSVCIVNFHNSQVPQKDRPYIYLAHELIHCLHSLKGTKHRENDEPATIGLNEYANDPLTENQFLTDYGFQRRTHY